MKATGDETACLDQQQCSLKEDDVHRILRETTVHYTIRQWDWFM
jgi:hypothetical protein